MRSKIERPKGTAGNDFNIQDEMGLGGCDEDRQQYLTIMAETRDLVLEAGIKWEVPWSKTPAELKGKFYAVARERHPILKRYVNDWAAEELAKQFIKNRRRGAYRKQKLERPAQYAYLKDNSAKRDPSAPRGRQGVKATTKDKKSAAKKSSVAKQGGSRTGMSAKAKGKRKAVEPEESSSDDEDEFHQEEAASDEDDKMSELTGLSDSE
ncbi:hypothetical protein C8F04DRAFT_52437 [Mycena alexandri]|uniref:Uncharacterized protein n=1 Tax=Mycena alexandri TaxID=1745969 RepID=A0AAD6SKT1_9AGAR|nr:hypothetical protein C8F04DRAFT_52437 [Mycena alexandri]